MLASSVEPMSKPFSPTPTGLPIQPSHILAPTASLLARNDGPSLILPLIPQPLAQQQRLTWSKLYVDKNRRNSLRIWVCWNDILRLNLQRLIRFPSWPQVVATATRQHWESLTMASLLTLASSTRWASTNPLLLWLLAERSDSVIFTTPCMKRVLKSVSIYALCLEASFPRA